MKKIILFLFGVIIWSNTSFAQETTSKKLSNQSVYDYTTLEQKKKSDQLNELKTECPHFPKVVSNGQGINEDFNTSFNLWKKDFPIEYISYQRIFDIKN